METERRAEIEQYPRGDSRQVRYLSEHLDILPVLVRLELLAPGAGPFGISMLPVLRLTSEFRDDDRLAGSHIPSAFRRTDRPWGVPAHVFVERNHIEVLGEIILNPELAVLFLEIDIVKGGSEKASGINAPGECQFPAQKGVTSRRRTGLVRHAPESDGTAVLVPVKHFGEHAERLVHGSGILEIDSLPYRNFLPEDDSHLLGHADNVLILRIMRKPYHIHAQSLGLGKEHGGIRLGICPSHALWNLLMERDAAHERRFSVDEDTGSIHIDVPETDLL